MSEKKIYYYSFNIKEKGTNQKISYIECKNLIKNILELTNGKGINLNPNQMLKIDNQTIDAKEINLDVLANDERYFFFRLGNSVGSDESLLRNTVTKDISEVGDKDNYLEICTYGFIDYKYNILGYLKSKGAPSHHHISELINIYKNDYFMSIENISSPDTVEALYQKGSVLAKIEYTCVNPDMTVLSKLGLSREQVADLNALETSEVKIIISNGKRNIITNAVDAIKNLGKSFKQNKNIKDPKFKGKTAGGRRQDYSFELENFNTKVDIAPTKVEGGIIVRKTLKEISDEVIIRVKGVYNDNIAHILRFASKDV